MIKDKTHIVKEVRKTPEYAAIIELGMRDITTAKNARRGSMFFATCLPSRIGRCFEYSVYSSGYLRLYNPGTKRYAMCHQFHIERADAESALIEQYRELLKALPRIYNRKAKKEGLFDELKALEVIEDRELPLFAAHPWKFSHTRQMYLERLKTGNMTLEAEIA